MRFIFADCCATAPRIVGASNRPANSPSHQSHPTDQASSQRRRWHHSTRTGGGWGGNCENSICMPKLGRGVRMSEVGHNRTCRPSIVMSALLRLTDSSRTSRHVRKVPTSDIVGSTTSVAAHPRDRQKLSSKVPQIEVERWLLRPTSIRNALGQRVR
jgi:hypothetical protein